jgi:hypothetical protein
MMECMPESDRCNYVYSVGLATEQVCGVRRVTPRKKIIIKLKNCIEPNLLIE